MSLFAFQFENTMGLIAFIPCPSRKCSAAWLCGQLQQQKTGRGTVEQNYVGCSLNVFIFHFILFFPVK